MAARNSVLEEWTQTFLAEKAGWLQFEADFMSIILGEADVSQQLQVSSNTGALLLKQTEETNVLIRSALLMQYWN